jgi:hypothetical protein
MEGVVFDTYGIASDLELHILTIHTGGYQATLTFSATGRRQALRLINPQPLSALVGIFEDCHGIRVIDQNAAEGNQLQFGRYRVEFWDEDQMFGRAIVDTFEVGC